MRAGRLIEAPSRMRQQAMALISRPAIAKGMRGKLRLV